MKKKVISGGNGDFHFYGLSVGGNGDDCGRTDLRGLVRIPVLRLSGGKQRDGAADKIYGTWYHTWYKKMFYQKGD